MNKITHRTFRNTRGQFPSDALIHAHAAQQIAPANQIQDNALIVQPFLWQMFQKLLWIRLVFPFTSDKPKSVEKQLLPFQAVNAMSPAGKSVLASLFTELMTQANPA